MSQAGDKRAGRFRSIRHNHRVGNIPAAHAPPTVEADLVRVAPQIFKSFLHHQSMTSQTIHGSPPSAITPGATGSMSAVLGTEVLQRFDVYYPHADAAVKNAFERLQDPSEHPDQLIESILTIVELLQKR